MEKLHIAPLEKLKKHTISIPGSKSYTNRALLAAALAHGTSELTHVLFSDDTNVMVAALKALGVKITKKGTTLTVTGCKGKFKEPKEELFFQNAGTAIRFMLSALAIQDFECVITGNDRMKERPIGDLVDALRQGGGEIEYLEKEGYPPLRLKGGFKGGKITIPGNVSSQYVSSLLLVSPYTEDVTQIHVSGEMASKPYVDMTIEIMKKFGIKKGKRNGYKQIAIKNGEHYVGTECEIEADASSASYFFALAALHGEEITVKNAKYKSKQGDIKFVDLLKQAGCEVTIKEKGITVKGPENPADLKVLGTIDMNTMPDVALTMAIIAAFTPGKTRLTNIPNLRVKECDRILAMTTELNKLNCKARQMADGIEIKGHPHKYTGTEIETYDDHRIAMCFGIVGTLIDGITIMDPMCVSKTYPTYWDDLEKMGAIIEKQ